MGWKMAGMAMVGVMATLVLSSTTTSKAPASDDDKKAALKVLELKCNSCHKDENRTKVFTFENMDAQAENIYKQVFIKRKMPKRKAPQLTDTEKSTLMAWLETQVERQR